MRLQDKLRVKFNHNTMDRLNIIDEELVIYSVNNGYEFNPDTIEKFISYEVYVNTFKDQIITFLKNKIDNNEDISSIIKVISPKILVELFTTKKELLNKYYDCIKYSLNYFDKDFIVENLDVEKLECNNSEIFESVIKKPDILLKVVHKIERKKLIEGIKSNISLYYDYFNDLDYEIMFECKDDILKYALDNNILPNEKTPKILLSSGEYAGRILSEDPSLISIFSDEANLDDYIRKIANAIKEKKVLLPIPVVGIYSKYLTIEKAIYLNHHEIINDLEKLHYLFQITSDEEMYEFLLESGFNIDSQIPEFLFSNKYILKSILEQGIKINTDLKFINLDVDTVYDLFLANYSVEDINKTNLFYSNSKIVDWGLEHGLSLDNLGKSTMADDYMIVGDCITVTKPSISSIDKLIKFIKQSGEKYKIYVKLSYSGLNDDGETFTYSNVEYLQELKRQNVEIYFTYKSNLKHSEDNLDDVDYEYNVDQVIEYEKALQQIVDEIKSKNLSPFERYIYVYDIVKNFKQYKDSGIGAQGRGIYTLFSADSMVCAGYANLLSNILARLGIGNRELGCITDGLHSRNYIYIKDDKYGIDGYYQCDATFDSSNDMKYEYLLMPQQYADSQLVSSEKLGSRSSIRTLDPVFFESTKGKFISDEEIETYIDSKQNKDIDYHKIIAAIMAVKRTMYSDERVLSYIERELYRSFMFSHYVTQEQKNEISAKNDEFVQERKSAVKDFSYEQALSSEYIEDIDYFISGINDILKQYHMGYDKNEKCVAGYIDEKEVGYFESLGCVVTLKNNHYMFKIPYNLILSMGQQENANEIISKLVKNASLNNTQVFEETEESKQK